MTRQEIKAALALKGITCADLDRKHGLPEGTCRWASLGRRLPKGETAIAEELGVPVWRAFPQNWRRDGTRIDNRLTVQTTPEREQSDSQKSGHTLTAGRAA
jgi:lambda repressor-like predicted transcriptional regulator